MLLGLVVWARVMAGRVAPRPSSGPALYATAILQELESPGHRIMQHDPDYRRRLFRRYAVLLRKDMAQLRGLGWSPSRYFWYSCFRLYHALLSMRTLPRVLGLEPVGLRILLGIMAPLIKKA